MDSVSFKLLESAPCGDGVGGPSILTGWSAKMQR